MDNPKIPLTRAEISRRWRENNPERNKELYTKYYHENKDELRARQNEWRKNNPDYRGGNKVSSLNTDEGWAKYKVQSIRAGARRRGIECTINYEDILDVMVSHCPVLGVELDYSLCGHKGKMQPNSPHVDRIDNTKGYVTGNVIIVSGKVNRVKSNLTLDEIPEVMNSIIKFYDKYNKNAK